MLQNKPRIRTLILIAMLALTACDRDGNFKNSVDQAEEEDRDRKEQAEKEEPEREPVDCSTPYQGDPVCPGGTYPTRCVADSDGDGRAWGC